jgi:hypothetical protein
VCFPERHLQVIAAPRSVHLVWLALSARTH